MYNYIMVKERQVIINNEISISTVDHPDEAIRNKDWIVELFCKDVENAKLVERRGSAVAIYIIEIDEVPYSFSFDTTDSGGKVDRRKVAIPFNAASFKDSLENEENVFVVNLYRPLISEEVVDTENRIWAIIDPLEIYNAKPYLEKTWNSSSRWVGTTKFLEQINRPEMSIYNGKNVYLAKNENVKQILTSNSIRSKYYLMNDVKMIANRMLEDPDESKEFARLRQSFRKMLLQTGGNNLIGSTIQNDSLLIASHIERVEDIRKSDVYTLEEKKRRIADPDNGLLIPTGLDALFDKYLVTFTDNWEIILSKEVTDAEVSESINKESIQGKLITGKGNNSLEYLRIHREKAFSLRNY